MNHLSRSFLMTATVIVSLAAGTVHASTNDVFRARLLLRGAYQDTNAVTLAPVIAPALLDTRHIINLALGRPLTNAVPSHEVLALMRDTDDHDRSLIVFDTNTQSNLVTVADIDGEGRVRQPGRAVFIWSMEVETAGTASNGLTDGEFCVAGTRIRTNATFLIRGKLIGTLDVISSGNSFRVIVPDGRLTIRGPAIGRVIE